MRECWHVHVPVSVEEQQPGSEYEIRIVQRCALCESSIVYEGPYRPWIRRWVEYWRQHYETSAISHP